MTGQLLTIIISTLTLLPIAVFSEAMVRAVQAEEATTKNVAQEKFNQVYVKLIMPTDPAGGDKNQHVVESWIAEDLKKRGQTKFVAITDWVLLFETGGELEDPTLIWEGGCRVHADISKRKNGRIKIFLDGWAPFSTGVTVSMADEPGNRAIEPVKQLKDDNGMPYVAVHISPPAKE